MGSGELRKLDDLGFTLLEVLMVVIMIAILAALGVTAFVNYSTDAKNAATKANLQILRNGIGAGFGTAQLRCGDNGDLWPPVSSINLNDIAQYAPPDLAALCTDAEVPGLTNRQFVGATGVPVNPWGIGVVGISNKVYDCTQAPASGVGANPMPTVSPAPAGACDTLNNLNCATGVAYVHSAQFDDGWCYDSTAGRIWANSQNNGAPIVPSTIYESSY